jgi:transposase
MQTITTIGLDIAKSVFQVHGIDAEGNVVLRRQLKRRYVLAYFQKLPPCLVGIAWSALKPAPRRIIGRENSRRLATLFA